MSIANDGYYKFTIELIKSVDAGRTTDLTFLSFRRSSFVQVDDVLNS